MDYFYHYYNDCDHQSTFSPLTVDQCYCPSSTFLLSLNIILLAILIYTFTMDKVTINFNTKLPFVSITEDESSLISPESKSTVNKRVRSPSGSLDLLKLPSKSTESSKILLSPATTTFNGFPSPSNFSLGHNQDDGKLVNLESTAIYNEPFVSPVASLNSFGSSSGSKIIKKKIIPNLSFNLSLSDSSMSSSSPPTDEDSRLLKDGKDDSLKDFLVLIHNGTEEDHHQESTRNQISFQN